MLRCYLVTVHDCMITAARNDCKELHQRTDVSAQQQQQSEIHVHATCSVNALVSKTTTRRSVGQLPHHFDKGRHERGELFLITTKREGHTRNI